MDHQRNNEVNRQPERDNESQVGNTSRYSLLNESLTFQRPATEPGSQNRILENAGILPTLSISDSTNSSRTQAPPVAKDLPAQAPATNRDLSQSPRELRTPGEAQINQPAQSPLSSEGKNLVDLARTRILDNGRPNTPQELRQFERDVKQFEQRAREQNLSQEQVRNTFAQVSRLLESKGNIENGVHSERQRIRLAEQIMSKAADTTSSGQGQNSTCNVATIENRLYTREPATAARLVADLALTGSHTTADGTKLTLHPQNLRPQDHDAGQNNTQGQNSRTFADQIFQVAAANLVYANSSEKGSALSKFEFRQGPNKAQMLYHGDPSKLSDEDRKRIGNDEPHSSDIDQMVKINKMLTGRNEPEVFMAHQSEADAAIINQFGSVREFEAKLLELKEKNQLPAILGVHANLLPDSRPESQRQGIEDGHVITVTGITQGRPGEPARITYQNQWGSDLDRGPENDVSSNELYRATRPPLMMDTIKILEQQRDQGKITPRQLAEILKGKSRELEASWAKNNPRLDQEQIQDREAFRAYIQKHFGRRA